jgi:hypothetical protein
MNKKILTKKEKKIQAKKAKNNAYWDRLVETYGKHLALLDQEGRVEPDTALSPAEKEVMKNVDASLAGGDPDKALGILTAAYNGGTVTYRHYIEKQSMIQSFRDAYKNNNRVIK